MSVGGYVPELCDCVQTDKNSDKQLPRQPARGLVRLGPYTSAYALTR